MFVVAMAGRWLQLLRSCTCSGEALLVAPGHWKQPDFSLRGRRELLSVCVDMCVHAHV